MVLDQLEKDSNDIMNLLKKERAERERDSNLIKERIDNEKKELQVRNAQGLEKILKFRYFFTSPNSEYEHFKCKKICLEKVFVLTSCVRNKAW